MESYDLYQLLPQHGMPWPVYLVYAHLRQQTFKVVRYSQERRKIIQEQISYLRDQKEEKERVEKEQQLLLEKEQQQQPQEQKEEQKQQPSPQLSNEKKRRPNFGLRLRKAAAEARPPPWDDLARHLAWDVYPPDAKFKIREPGLPAFSVLVTSHASPFPVERLQTLVQENDSVNIKVATVADTGTVILFGVTNIGAPSMAAPASMTNDGGSADAGADAGADSSTQNSSKEQQCASMVED